MSASDKKKLRKEQVAEFLSEKQRQEQAEAKKLRIYTIGFITAMILVVCIVIGVLGVRAVNQSGVFQKNTIAAIIGDRELNSVELGYYYNDAINEYYNEWYNQYSTYTDMYLQMVGLDTTKPMNKQIFDEESGMTWADYFVESAISSAKSDFAMYDKAMEEGFKLPEEKQAALDNSIKNMGVYAQLYGYSNTKQYLAAMYGYGADEESYTEYMTRSAIATAYYEAHNEGLTYDDAAIREYEKDKANQFNSYTYDYSYLSYTDFREGGTKDENGNTTYTDEENEAARAALKAAAKELATATSLDDLKAKIEQVKVNENSKLAVNSEKNQLHTAVSSASLSDWLAAEDRKEGDIAAIPNTSTIKDADGNEKAVINGYNVVIFNGKVDNAKKMSDVRHLLVQFKGGTEDKETGEVTYTAEEKAAAKTKAEEFLKQWQDGAKTEESFIELVKKNSDDSSASEGGLFKDINPDSQYVKNFLNWSISDERKVGDCEVIETEYGYHVMYYVGESELTYRDYMISNEMRAADQEKWYNAILETVTTSVGNTSKMPLDTVLSAG